MNMVSPKIFNTFQKKEEIKNDEYKNIIFRLVSSYTYSQSKKKMLREDDPQANQACPYMIVSLIFLDYFIY